MDEKCYKSNLLFQIVGTILRSIVIFIIMEFVIFFSGTCYAILNWLLLLVALLCSIIYTFFFQKIRIIIRNQDMIVIRGYDDEDVYSFQDHTIMVYEDENENTVLGHLSCAYKIKILDAYGNVTEVRCYSFSKEKYLELKQDVSAIYKKMEEEL